MELQAFLIKATAGYGGSRSGRQGNRAVEAGGVGFGPVDERAAVADSFGLRLLLGVMGVPLAPLHVSTSDPLPHQGHSHRVGGELALYEAGNRLAHECRNWINGRKGEG